MSEPDGAELPFRFNLQQLLTGGDLDLAYAAT
jgi:hypothetical protein